MFILPSRDETKAMCRPFGEKAGLSLVPTPSVRVRVWPVATSNILMSYPGPDCPAYAISLNGAGDHVGRSAFDSPNVSRRWFKPSASISQICAEPERSDVKAICVPVGDHVGAVSPNWLFVSRRTSEPFRFMT